MCPLVDVADGLTYTLAIEIRAANLPWRTRDDLLRGQDLLMNESPYGRRAHAQIACRIAECHQTGRALVDSMGCDRVRVARRADVPFGPGVLAARSQAEPIERGGDLFIRKPPGHATNDLDRFQTGAVPMFARRIPF